MLNKVHKSGNMMPDKVANLNFFEFGGPRGNKRPPDHELPRLQAANCEIKSQIISSVKWLKSLQFSNLCKLLLNNNYIKLYKYYII